jgi:replicative DNA helicase
MASDLLSYVQSKGWEFKSRGDVEISLRVCPFCGDEKFHFCCNVDVGLYRCWKCEAKGNLFTLKRQMGDVYKVTSTKEVVYHYKPKDMSAESYFGELDKKNYVDMELIVKWHEALLENNGVLRWLGERKIGLESVQSFALGVVSGEELVGMKISGHLSALWLAIPYFVKDVDGKVVCANVKFRTLPPAEKTFRMLEGHDKPLYNQAKLDPDKPVFVTEGELDAVVLTQEGWVNATSIPTGAGSFSPENYDALIANELVYLMYDTDEAGRKGAKEAAIRLGVGRCYNVVLPLKSPQKDITDYFVVGGTRERLLEVIEKTPRCGKNEVVSLDEAFSELAEYVDKEGEEQSGWPWPWPKLTEKAGRMKPGRLILLTAPPGIGKTAFAMNVALDLSKNGVPTLTMCLEMSIPESLLRVVGNVQDKDVTKVTDVDVSYARIALCDLPMYYARPEAGVTVEKALDTMRYAARRFGVKFIIFDNLHFLCRSLEHLVQEISNVTKAMKLLAEDLGVVIMLVAHPKKAAQGRSLRMEDIKDSASPSQDADLILALWRKKIPTEEDKRAKKDQAKERAAYREEGDSDEPLFGETVSDRDSYEATTLVNLLKSRYTAGGHMYLTFLGDRMRFVEQRADSGGANASASASASISASASVSAAPVVVAPQQNEMPF